MYRSTCVVLLFITFAAVSQPAYIPIRQPVPGSARLDTVNEDTLTLPFWDDFSAKDYIDPALWLYGQDTYVNNTQSINPPTKNVATFDGLNGLGFPHSISSEFGGPGDSLVSRPINLSLVTGKLRETVYLSFYWQIQGYGEIPNENDSLRLQFLNSSNQWITQDINPHPTILSLEGGLANMAFDVDSVQKFTQVIVPVTGPFLHSGFKFRFQSFTSLNGLYDNWHIDYVYLNSHRNEGDTLHFDRAIATRQSSLFEPYLSLPAEQFLSNPTSYLSTERISLSNLDNSFHPARFTYRISELVSGMESEILDITPPDMQPLEVGRVVAVANPVLPALSGDSLILQTEYVYVTGDKYLFEEVDENGDTLFLTPDLTINDTLRNRYILHDYLAYDDGSAEVAAGINLNQGQIAVRYAINSPDTLTDLLIYFPPIYPSTADQSINIRVWSDLHDLAIVREFSATVESTSRNVFQRFTLPIPVIVRDTFYVGFQQFTDNYIGIGLDKNNPAGSENIYSNTNREWEQNDRIIGSLMIRPQFKNGVEYVLGIEDNRSRISFYPNPATDLLNFDQHVDQAMIYTLSGIQVLQKSDTRSIDLSELPAGLYVLRWIQGKSGGSGKLIIR